VPYFSALKASIRGVPGGGSVSLKVVLQTIPLVAVGVLSSTEVVASVISSIVPSGWRPIPVDVHWDRGVIHPSGGVGGVVLGGVLSLGAGVVPLWVLLLWGECSKGSISSEYVP